MRCLAARRRVCTNWQTLRRSLFISHNLFFFSAVWCASCFAFFESRQKAPAGSWTRYIPTKGQQPNSSRKDGSLNHSVTKSQSTQVSTWTRWICLSDLCREFSLSHTLAILLLFSHLLTSTSSNDSLTVVASPSLAVFNLSDYSWTGLP